MLFTARSPRKGWRLNTLLATTHIPLKQVVRTLSPTPIWCSIGSRCWSAFAVNTVGSRF